MVLSYLITKYLVQPENISEDFNITAWNIANPDFYVPPHPLLYLLYLKPFTFALVTASNMLLPYDWSHVLQLIVLAGTIVLQPITGIPFLPNLFWKSLYVFGYYSLKAVEWKSLVSMLRQTHVLLSSANAYYWILNWYYFGIFATWPILRPDVFFEYENVFCAYWSC